MSEPSDRPPTSSDATPSLTAAAREELHTMGLAPPPGRRADGIDPPPGRPLVEKRAIRAPEVINEAVDYQPRPSSFSRGMRVELSDATLIFLSGTASVDERGQTVHPGDFQAQCLRAYRNMTALLAAEGASWHDVVRTTCYLRDIARDYDTFNEVRTMFFDRVGLDPVPASTGVEARLCRPDLLVEMEAIAVVPRR